MKRPLHLLGLLGLLPTLTLTLPAVEIIAHRGASAQAPENTVASANLAWKQNADAVEIDIYLSKDNQIVVIHDATTKRTAGRDAKVVDQTFAELRQLDAGQWKDPRWTGEKIPSLSEIIATVPETKRLVIEIKCGPEVIPPLKRLLNETTLTRDQIVIIGFSHDTMTRVKKQLPQFEAYWLASFKQDKETGQWTPTPDELIAQAKSAGVDGLNLSHQGPINAAFVQQIQKAGLRLFVWTVNDPNAARRLAQAGVEGITTDKPAWLRHQLLTVDPPAPQSGNRSNQP